MSCVRRFAVTCLLSACALSVGASSASAGIADVPTPAVSGPVAVSPGSTPFLAADPAQLARYGYVEQEFFVTGLASTYTTAGLTTGTRVATGGPNGNGTYPYKTRIVVRRPAAGADFNGTTLLEWYNVTAGFDVEWNWLNDPENMMRKGYAWVGVSAQNTGVNYLKGWNAGRYSTLDVRSSTPVADAMSYDIFGAVAKALRGAGTGEDPLGGLTTSRIIASGESQSGSRLNVYFNNVQPLHEVVDAFLITVAGGTLRNDRPQTKAIRVLSERENRTGPPATDPDQAAGYRRWDVAGSSHLPFMAYLNFAPIAARDVPSNLVADCTKRPLSRVPWPYVYNRAVDALTAWQGGGMAPATAPRMQYPAPSGAVLRDDNGNALGGIRLPEIEVPTATNTGDNTPKVFSGFSLFCGLLGSWEQFSSSKLHTSYVDYGDFVDRVAPKAQAVADAGFVNQEDVPRLEADAARYTRLRPTAPVLTDGSATPTKDQVTLGWRGPDPVATATTYEVEARDAADGVTTLADGLAARSATAGAGFPEGTYTFRVRGRTEVRALYPDPAVVETTPFSGASAAAKIDRTPPAAPGVTADRAPEYAAGGGWFLDTATASFAAGADPDLRDGSAGAGVDATTLPAPVTRATSGSQLVSGRMRDLVGNDSPAGTLTLQVDATAPALDVTCPATVLLRATGVTATVTATDAHSGLAADPSGSGSISTAAVRTVTTSASATDNVGKVANSSCATAVQYMSSGLLKPVLPDGSADFRLGTAVPLKLRLTDAASGPASGAVARVVVARVIGGTVGTFVPGTTNGGSGNQFKESTPGDYRFSLATKGMAAGVVALRVTLDDGTSSVTRIRLR